MTVIIIPGMPPEQARIAAMGQLAQARTCLLIAERLLTAAGPKLISAEAARLKLKLSWKLCKELLDEIRG